MIETFDLAGYCRISVDEELDRDNTSIENQKAIIEGFVRQKFPGSTLTFYEDRYICRWSHVYSFVDGLVPGSSGGGGLVV